jgi:hypothetical protein
MTKPMISCDEGETFVLDGPIYFICVDDDDEGTVTVYVKYLPETHQDDGEADRFASYEYDQNDTRDRARTRSRCEGLAMRWYMELRKKYPCDWGTNY